MERQDDMPGEEDRFDTIVIGAGPAGSACAYTLAKAGRNVLMIERGDDAGSKNVTGGRLYTYALDLLEPGWSAEAPMERKIVREQIMLLDKQSALTLDYADRGFADPVPQSYSILRKRFDPWLADKAEGAGVTTAYGILVDDVIVKEGRVAGVVAGEDEIFADVVVAADGVNALIAQKAGLRGEIVPSSVGIGVKEIIALPVDVLENRFLVGPHEGAARVFLGSTAGLPGGGFLYTNEDTISLGMVVNPEELGRQSRPIHDLFQDMKMHPSIYPLIADGMSMEYGAHLVPEGGLRSVPQKLYRDGLLLVGDAAGYAVNAGIILRGMDLAIVSGIAAARAVLCAVKPSDAGPEYLKQLDELKLTATMKHFAGWPDLLTIPRLFSAYPLIANDIMRFLFTVDHSVPAKIPKAVREILEKHASWSGLLADAWKGFRAL